MNKHSDIGMSSLDLLGDIPRGERVLLKIFLRNPVLSKEEYTQIIEELPEKKNLSVEEISEALTGLLKRGWIEEFEKGYTLRQQRKEKSRQSSKLMDKLSF